MSETPSTPDEQPTPEAPEPDQQAEPDSAPDDGEDSSDAEPETGRRPDFIAEQQEGSEDSATGSDPAAEE